MYLTVGILPRPWFIDQKHQQEILYVTNRIYGASKGLL